MVSLLGPTTSTATGLCLDLEYSLGVPSLGQAFSLIRKQLFAHITMPLLYHYVHGPGV